MRQSLLRVAFIVAGSLWGLSALSAQEVPVVQRSLDKQRLNDLAIWNIGGDDVFEIYTTDMSGNVGCYAADTLEPLWTHTFEGKSLTAPVVGNFMGTAVPVLAFGSSDGTVYFLWPGSGELISKAETGLSFNLAPSVAVRNETDELVFAEDSGYVLGYRLDPQSGLPRQTFGVTNTVRDAATISAIGSMTLPPACGDLNGDGVPEVILASNTGLLQVISLSSDMESGDVERYHTRITQNTRVTTLAAIGDFNGDGQPLFGYGIGANLQFFRWDPAGEPAKAIHPAFNATAYGNSLGHLLVGPVNSDALPDLVSTSESTIAARYLGSDLSGGAAMFDIGDQHMGTTNGPFSPPVPITFPEPGGKGVVSIDSSGTAFVWRPASHEPAERIAGLPVPTMFTPGGDITGSGKLSLVIWNEKDFVLSVATLPVDVAPPVPPGNSIPGVPAVTVGGSFSRSGQLIDDWGFLQENAAAALQRIKNSENATTEDDPLLSTDTVSIIAGIAPNDPLAEKLQIEGRDGGGFFYKVVGGAVVLLLIAGAFVMVKGRRK